jgi:predicted NAD/FAD-dependent oxidoreductase
MSAAFVIVGASLAGAKAAETLREEGFVNEAIQAIVRGGRTVDTGRLADPDVPLEEFAG